MGKVEPTTEEILDALDRRSLPADCDVERLVATIQRARPVRVATPRSSCTIYVAYDRRSLVLDLAIRGGAVERLAGLGMSPRLVSGSAPAAGHGAEE